MSFLKTERSYKLCRLFSNVVLPKIGDKVTVKRKITQNDVDKFTELSGDHNPIHSTQPQQRAVVHGALLNSFVSAVIGTALPGPGTLVVQQTLNFPNKCFVDDHVAVTVEMVSERKIILVKFSCVVKTDTEEKIVLHGDAKLIMSK